MEFLPFSRHIVKGEHPIAHTNDKFKKSQVNQCYGICIDTDRISKKKWILPTPPLNVQWQKLISLHVRKLRQSWILDSTLWIVDSLPVKPGLRIPIVSGIPDSFSWIPHSKAKNSGLLYKAIDTLRKL